jgi:hypothetical protein
VVLFRNPVASFEYTVTFDYDNRLDKTALLAHLASCLQKLEARDIHTNGESVTFRGGLFRAVNKSNILIPFGHGVLTIHTVSHEVRCQLIFRQLVYAATILMGLAATSAFLVSGRSMSPPIFLFCIGWLWLVGGNVLIGIQRFRRFLRTAIDSTLPDVGVHQKIQRG